MCRVWKLGHVDVEMAQLVSFCLFQHMFGAFSYGIDAAQISGRVDVGVGGLWQRDLRQACAAGGITWRALHCMCGRVLRRGLDREGIVGGVLLGLAREQAHDPWGPGVGKRRSG